MIVELSYNNSEQYILIHIFEAINKPKKCTICFCALYNEHCINPLTVAYNMHVLYILQQLFLPSVNLQIYTNKKLNMSKTTVSHFSPKSAPSAIFLKGIH